MGESDIVKKTQSKNSEIVSKYTTPSSSLLNGSTTNSDTLEAGNDTQKSLSTLLIKTGLSDFISLLRMQER